MIGFGRSTTRFSFGGLNARFLFALEHRLSDRFNAPSTVLAAEEAVAPVCTELGYELLGCELTTTRGRPTLRLFVDKEGGTGIDDCVRVHRAVTDLLDTEELFPGAWVLEVSSPGLDRQLFRRAHLKAAEGGRVRIRLHLGVDGRRRVKGLLERVSDEDAAVRTDDDLLIVFDISDIDKAHLVWDGDKK